MPFTFDIYSDAGLTTPGAAAIPLIGLADVGAPPVDVQLFFGSVATGMKCQADSAPGVAQITVSLTDADALSGHPATDILLATTQAGLAGATPGAALNLGTTVLSGVGNAVEFWVRLVDSTHSVETDNQELGITLNPLTESAV